MSDVQVTCFVAPDAQQQGSFEVHVEARPAEPLHRAPADLVAVVDVSGSMAGEATIQNMEGEQESHGLSALDLVMHALRTIIAVLEPQDTLSLVAYSSGARTLFSNVEMNQSGKSEAIKQLNSLKPDGQTNMWGGLAEGFGLIDRQGRIRSVLLLTDGKPNIEPEGGTAAATVEYLARLGSRTTLSTFGFGYELDSVMLAQMATAGGGMYYFIPDGGFVGTTFIHAVANILSQMPGSAVLEVQPAAGIFTDLSSNSSSNTTVVEPATQSSATELVALQHGQPRTVTAQVTVPHLNSRGPTERLLEFSITTNSGKHVSTVCAGQLLAAANGTYKRSLAAEASLNARRLKFCSVVGELLQEQPSTQQANKVLTQLQSDLVSQGAVEGDGILADLEGQVLQAFSRADWFGRWGQHYLRSLLMAHTNQQCTNFKDIGLQQYAQGALFNQLRDSCDDLFLQLPAPEAAAARRQTVAEALEDMGLTAADLPAAVLAEIKQELGVHEPAAPPAPVDMRVYHNQGNSCFKGDCKVTLASGKQCTVDGIQAGDQVMCGGLVATVRCVLKSHCLGGTAMMVTMAGGLCCTPYHPIVHENRWRFPIDVSKPHNVECDAVFSFLLDQGNTITINDIECICLGHGIKDDQVAAHPFYGTQQVVRALKALPGWSEGHVEMLPLNTTRDPKTGLVNGFLANRSSQIRT